jgi:hypothetical protein
MSSELQKNLDYVNAYRENRLKGAQTILENPDYFPELISVCFDINDKNTHKACWILEFVSYEKLEWLQPHLDFFCSNLKKLKDESSIRPIANFDWLITDTKVAAKAYSMRTLHILGKYYDWIHPELQIILTKDYANHTAAYKAVAREVLKKIK